MLKAQDVGHFAHRQARGNQLFLGLLDKLVVDVLLGTLASERAQHAVQVTGRHVQALGQVMHRRDAPAK